MFSRGTGSDQWNAADVDAPDAAPVVPMTSRNMCQPERAEIKGFLIEDQGSDMEACKRVAHAGF